MSHLSHSMNNRNNRNEKTAKKKESDTETDSSSTYSTTSLSQISIDSLELDSDSIAVEEDNEEYVKHENLLSTEELNGIKNDLCLYSRNVQTQFDTYFVDNKVIDFINFHGIIHIIETIMTTIRSNETWSSSFALKIY